MQAQPAVAGRALVHDATLRPRRELGASGRRREQSHVAELRVERLVNVGDPVVHSAHGIGRYRGLVNLDLGRQVICNKE